MAVANSDSVPGQFMFGISSGAGSTGAPGSPTPDGSGGPDTMAPGSPIASPVVTALYDSVQVDGNRPTVAVGPGDTSSASSDVPIVSNPLLPGDAGQYMQTGAGAGNPDPYRHPNGADR